MVLHGGIGPAPRRRALAALRFEEREEISRGIAVGQSIQQMTRALNGRHRRSAGDQAQRRQSGPIVQTGLIGVPGSGRCTPSLVVLRHCAARYDGAWRRKLALRWCAAADLRLAEAGVPSGTVGNFVREAMMMERGK